MIFVSYYTANTHYEGESKILIDSLNRFKLPHDIRAIQNFGTWQENTMYKAQFIKQMLSEHKDKSSIVWIDVDAVIESHPEYLFQIDTDIAVYYRTKGASVERLRQRYGWNKELVSATMYFKTNDSSMKLLDMWIESNKKDEACLEQRNLQKVVELWRKEGGTLSWLPQQYNRIFDAQEDLITITQNQASRRFASEVERCQRIRRQSV